MSYREYVSNFKSIDNDTGKKLINMYNRIRNKELPYNYILFKSLQLQGKDTKNIPKISSLDKVEYYDKIWKSIAWKNDWLTCESKSLAKSRSIPTNRYDIYINHYKNEISNDSVPIDVQQKLLELFNPIWEIYIKKYCEYKFIPCDFMVRKLLQNIGENKYLKFYPRKINDKNTLTIFEELWKKICKDMNIVYY